MWIYIITLTIMVSVPCERNTHDEFGRRIEYSIYEEGHCWKRKEHIKEFTGGQQARDYYTRAVSEIDTKNWDVIGFDRITHVEIDSVYFHKSKKIKP